MIPTCLYLDKHIRLTVERKVLYFDTEVNFCWKELRKCKSTNNQHIFKCEHLTQLVNTGRMVVRKECELSSAVIL